MKGDGEIAANQEEEERAAVNKQTGEGIFFRAQENEVERIKAKKETKRAAEESARKAAGAAPMEEERAQTEKETVRKSVDNKFEKQCLGRAILSLPGYEPLGFTVSLFLHRTTCKFTEAPISSYWADCTKR